MRRILLSVLMKVTLFSLAFLIASICMAETAKPGSTSCKTCHDDFTSVLPKSHIPVKGSDLADCTYCHVPKFSGESPKNVFSTRIHMAHLAFKSTFDCMICHTWTPGKTFGLFGHEGSWGALKTDDMTITKQVFVSWASSNYTDNLHARAGIMCSQCHGKDIAKADDTVENSRCLTCHGPMDTLILKSDANEFNDRNPHKSHLGTVACTLCHHAHGKSKVYCLSCHRSFKMKIQGTTK